MDSQTYWRNRETEQRKHDILDEREYQRHIEEIYQNMINEIEITQVEKDFYIFMLNKRKEMILEQAIQNIEQNKKNDIDMFDKFFRKSTYATIPFTDGISYDYSYPNEAPHQS